MKISKTQLIHKIKHNTDHDKNTIVGILDLAFDVIQKELIQGNEVVIAPLGILSPLTRKAKVGVNPQTREKINIPEQKSVKLKVSKNLKEVLNY